MERLLKTDLKKERKKINRQFHEFIGLETKVSIYINNKIP